MTPRRIASQQCTQVPHSATGDSRKDALWGCHSHGKAHFACGPHQRARSACGQRLRREVVFADLCTLLRTHGRSRDRAGATGPTTSRAHCPRGARVPGPEVHATGAVTQPSTHTSSRSLILIPPISDSYLPCRTTMSFSYESRIERSGLSSRSRIASDSISSVTWKYTILSSLTATKSPSFSQSWPTCTYHPLQRNCR